MSLSFADIRELAETEPEEPNANDETEEAGEGSESEGEQEAGGSEDVEPEIEMLTFKTPSGEEIQVPANAVASKKIDGELQDVELAKALDGYGGELAVGRRFGELGTQKKDLQRQQQQFDTYKEKVVSSARSVLDAAKGKDLEALIDAAAEMAGEDPEQYFQAFIDSTSEQIGEYNNLDPQEREAIKLQREKKRFEKERGKLSKQTSSDADAQRINEHVTQNGITVEDIELGQKVLNEQIKAGQVSENDLKILERVQNKTATVDEKLQVMDYLSSQGRTQRSVVFIESKVKELAPNLKPDSKEYRDLVEDAYYATRDPNPRTRVKDENDLVTFLKPKLNGASPKKEAPKAEAKDSEEESEVPVVEVIQTHDHRANSKSTSNTNDFGLGEGQWNPFN